MKTGEEIRDEQLSLVLSNQPQEWKDKVYNFASKLRGWEGTGEDFRVIATEVVGEPTSANAWGALINRLIREGIFKKTGELRKMKQRTSHARMTPVYRSYSFQSELPTHNTVIKSIIEKAGKIASDRTDFSNMLGVDPEIGRSIDIIIDSKNEVIKKLIEVIEANT